jgi:hypothetical protein
MTQKVAHLPSKHKALSSIPSTTKNKTKQMKRKEKLENKKVIRMKIKIICMLSP